MKKLVLIILVLVLSGFGYSTIQSNLEQVQTIKFTSTDGSTTFKIKNWVENQPLEPIKEKILAAYLYIKEETIQTDYKHEDVITIHLYEGNQRSYATKKEIVLYAFDNYDYVIAHELAHVLLGYNFQQEAHLGMLTQEGFAEYVQIQLGNEQNYNYQISPHKHANYFFKQGALSSLTDLIDNEPLLQLVTNPKNGHMTTDLTDTFRIWMFYVEAASFVSFLIDVYGLEQFEKVYNQPYLLTLLPAVYEKNIPELEQEWHTYLANPFFSYKEEELLHPTVKSVKYYVPLLN